MKFLDAIAWAAAELGAAGIENPRREARLLAAHLTGQPATILANPADIDERAYQALVRRRAGHEPLAFITGRRGFWTLDLAVTPATLIPRADSETLIEAAVALFPDRALVRTILDLGTGTGCLLLAALSEYPAAFGTGIDISPGAAQLAVQNAQMNGMAERACFIAGDWTAAITGRFDLILSNPPYIASADLAGLMPEVASHEPATALDGGPVGMAAYAEIMPRLPGLLAPHGAAILELGAGQLDDVTQIARAAGFTRIAHRADLAGIPRALICLWGRGDAGEGE